MLAIEIRKVDLLFFIIIYYSIFIIICKLKYSIEMILRSEAMYIAREERCLFDVVKSNSFLN